MGVLAKEIEATYEVLSKMGEGGMGAVYKVRHRFFDEIRVIKVMQAEMEAVGELQERFLGEAKRGKQLRHPNLAEVLDFSVAADGTSYMVMEYIEGVNLRELMTRNNGPLDYTLLVPIAEQALAALGYLHEKKFVHRDISPDNIMLTSEGEGGETRVKLIDLGIAKSLEATKSLTMAGKFIGKVQYASPEQFSGRVDARSDLYSFGIVLYELLTGAKPITGKDYFAILGAHLSKPPRSFGETDPDNRVPAVIREAVLKALAKRPEDRFQSAGEFAAALRSTLAPSEQRTLEIPIATTLPAVVDAPPAVTEISEEVTVQTAPVAPPPPRTVQAGLPRWYPIAAGIALLLLAGIAVVWMQSRKTTTSEPTVSREPPLTLTLSPPLRGEGTVEVSAPAPVPAPVPGQLLINAFPWGRVTSVKNAAGEEQLTAGASDTPLLLPALPPGSYKVRLTNPNSNRSVELDAIVTSATLTRTETELDRIDAAAYVEGIGRP